MTEETAPKTTEPTAPAPPPREEKAAALGMTPIAFIRSYAYAALDPGEQLLMAPVLAAPVALARAGLTLQDIDLVEMHEAFAAQVLSNLRGLDSDEWAARAGVRQPVGEVDRARLNVMGGSVAIGHPFGATGARITTTLANELARRGGQFGLMTVGAAGGLGFAMVIERGRRSRSPPKTESPSSPSTMGRRWRPARLSPPASATTRRTRTTTTTSRTPSSSSPAADGAAASTSRSPMAPTSSTAGSPPSR